MNIADEINAVIRRVAATHEAHVVALEQTFATTAADLWAACTDPQRLPRWFEPVEGDLHQGGHYRLTDSGTEGTIERCQAPTALRITWEYDGTKSYLEATIQETDGGARLKLEHTVPDDDHWRRYGPAATGIGWDGSLLALAFLLADDPRATPEQMAKFNASDEGRKFIAAAATAWKNAHIAAGADPATAQQAADRTADFYRAQ
jgi:uncharacterized protein YndB with AHSA1/START domain